MRSIILANRQRRIERRWNFDALAVPLLHAGAGDARKRKAPYGTASIGGTRA